MMSPEDEAFNDIERQANKQRKEAVKAAMRRAEDDDDIQIYQRPWVGLTDEEITELRLKTLDAVATNHEVYRAIEAKLKEKNNGV
jgi:hypothetical protein